MYISLNWLKDFVELPDNLDPNTLGETLTLKTAEVEKVIDQKKEFDHMVAGLVKEVHPHPNADKLKITKTSIGNQDLQIVCGGENLYEGMYVAVAKIGAKVKWHGQDEMTMERVKIRGVESEGMICAGEEIGISDTEAGEKDVMDLSALKPEPGTPLAEVFQKNDVIFEFDNKALTHRPDLWGHYGIAREVAALTDNPLKPISPQVEIPENGESLPVEVKIPDLCPRYCGIKVSGIKVTASPLWLSSRLKAIGHGTHNNIVDITNYVMNELGQPLHAFDSNNIEGGIIVRTAEKGEKIHTLDQKECELDETMLIIADHKKPVAIAGVIGGEFSGINENTTSIIIESANFAPASVRKTSIKLGIRTDSVQRFEKSLDPVMAETALKRALELILQICPDAKIEGPITDIQNFNREEKTIVLNTKKARSKIGVEIDDHAISKILTSLDFTVQETATPQIYNVTIPSYRATKDVEIEDDLIEEIARIYGYENIDPELPNLPARLPMENTERSKKHRAREIFSHGFGFDEVYNYSFYGKETIKKCLLDEAIHLKLLNYLSEDQTHLRTSLVPNMLKNIQDNLRYFEKFNLYEIGRIYEEEGNFFPIEHKKITAALVSGEKTDEIFYKAKGYLEEFLKISGIRFTKPISEIRNAPYAHPAKALTYLSESGETLAQVFMLHPVVAKNFDLEKIKIAFIDINFTKLNQTVTIEKKYRPISKFPAITFDVSVMVESQTLSQTIEEAIEKADKNLIKSVELFDLYEGPSIETGKKALAYKITLQSEERTLTDQDMTNIQNKVFENLEKLGGIIRGR